MKSTHKQFAVFMVKPNTNYIPEIYVLYTINDFDEDVVYSIAEYHDEGYVSFSTHEGSFDEAVIMHETYNDYLNMTDNFPELISTLKSENVRNNLIRDWI